MVRALLYIKELVVGQAGQTKLTGGLHVNARDGQLGLQWSKLRLTSHHQFLITWSERVTNPL